MIRRFALALLPFAALAAEEPPLVDYVVENAASIPEPLVQWSGDPAEGAAVFAAAGCADCHRTPGEADGPAIGPDLSDVGARLTAGEIRLMIVNPAILDPETEMPAYYEVGRLGEAPEALVGRTRLSAMEVEALAAWLAGMDGE